MLTRERAHILSVGNSFSDDAQVYLYEILNSFGVRDICIENLYIGGCTIDTHYDHVMNADHSYTWRKNTKGFFESIENMDLRTILLDQNWDCITFQQASGKSGCEETYSKLYDLVEEVMSMIPALLSFPGGPIPSLAWHMTWAYQKDSTHGEFPIYQSNQDVMYQKIIDVTKKVIAPHKEWNFLFPCGTAIQNARTSELGDTWTRDGYHLEDLGQFIAGLTWVLAMTGWKKVDMDQRKIPQKFLPYLDLCFEVVEAAIRSPFTVTKAFTRIEKRNPICEYQKRVDVPYHEGITEDLLDIYLPDICPKAILLHFHGGGLSSGSKDDFAHQEMMSQLALQGIIAVSANYRMYPNARFPDFIQDEAYAIKYMIEYKNTQKLHCPLIVSGQSAGAYMSMLCMTDSKYLQQVGLKIEDVDGWLIESGQPTAHFQVLQEYHQNADSFIVDERAPMYYVNHQMKFQDCFLISYTRDITCRLAQNNLFYETVVAMNPHCAMDFQIYPGLHCNHSTGSYRNLYPHTKITLAYIDHICKKIKQES